MSDALLNAGRQTLMLELQEASRLPERLGDDFVRAANTIITVKAKSLSPVLVNQVILAKKLRRPSPVPARLPFLCIRRKRCTVT